MRVLVTLRRCVRKETAQDATNARTRSRACADPAHVAMRRETGRPRGTSVAVLPGPRIRPRGRFPGGSMAAGPNRRCASPLPGCLGATGSPLAAPPPVRNAPLEAPDAPVDRCGYIEDVFRRFGETFRRLFDHVPSGIYEATADGRVVLANAWFARLLGYAAPGDLEGIPLAALDVDPDRRAAFLDALNSHGEVNNAEHQLRRTDGTAVTVLESAFLVRGEDGRILHIQDTL